MEGKRRVGKRRGEGGERKGEGRGGTDGRKEGQQATVRVGLEGERRVLLLVVAKVFSRLANAQDASRMHRE